MYLCAAGDTHGALNRFYDNVLALEDLLGLRFDWILHVGDFGIWPDPERIDRATRKHGDIGDFPAWLDEKRAAPRPTLFIKGNHEDFDWLEAQPDGPVLPGLFHLRNGHTMELGTAGTTPIRIGGVGGCYGPSDYTRQARRLQGYAKRHYTFDEIERLSSAPRPDIVLTHDAPKGFRFESHRNGRNFVSPAEGLDTLLARTRPRVCFFGHHHTRVDGEVSGTRCIGLNIVGHPGHLVAFEMTPHESAGRLSASSDVHPKALAARLRASPRASSMCAENGAVQAIFVCNQCAQIAHAPLQLTENKRLSARSIIGASERRTDAS